MSRIKNILLSIASFLALGLILFGSYLILKQLISEINALDPNVVASLIVALAAVFGYLYNQRKSKLREISEAHRLQKVNLYKGFMDLIVDILMETKKEEFDKTHKEELSANLEKKFIDFTRDLILWGSPEVIKTFKKFRESSGLAPSPKIIVFVDDILLAMRKDLGHSNFGLKKGDLIKLFLKDPHELDRILKDAKVK